MTENPVELCENTVESVIDYLEQQSESYRINERMKTVDFRIRERDI